MINFNDFDLAYKSLLKHIYIVDNFFISLPNSPKTEYTNDLYNIWLKAIFHSYSLKHLINGTYAENFKKTFIDYSSAYVLSRALYESMLTMFYIFFDFESEEEKEFKYNVWYYSGFHERQSFRTLNSETINKKNNESNIINEYKTKIITSKHYSLLSPKERSSFDKNVLLYGKWQLESWYKIAEKMGISEQISKDLYKHLCGYAHSGKNSILQFSQLHDNSLRKKQLLIPNITACISMANLIKLMRTYISKHLSTEINITLLEIDLEYYDYYLKLTQFNANDFEH